jgi:hypothetical protein
MTRHERRETRFLRMRRAAQKSAAHPHLVPFSENDPLPYTDAQIHHDMSKSRKHSRDAFSFSRNYRNDPASKVSLTIYSKTADVQMTPQNFVPRLKDHLLGRLLNQGYDGDEQLFSDDDRNTVHIVDNRLYSAKVLRVNYTTYDVRRGQDSFNPGTQHCDLMVNSCEDDPEAHPYWYARIIGIFHLRVLHASLAATTSSELVQDMQFLWVRWFGIDPSYRSGLKVGRLPKIGFVPENDDQAFGFLDPALVIRGCHLIPAFADGRTVELLRTGVTAARPIDEVDDWAAFYVNMYVIIYVGRFNR